MARDVSQETVTKTFEHLRGIRYGEIIVLTKDAQGYYGVSCNSVDLPFDLAKWHAIDPDKLAAEFGGDAAWMNGPRQALVDTLTVELLDGGRVMMLGGIPMYIVSTLHFPDLSILSAQNPPYTDQLVKRTTEWVIGAGKQVFELVSPGGAVYGMRACSQHIDPNLTMEQLPTLGARLTLPAGWQYRVRTADQDLVVCARNFDAHVVLDEFENFYQREGG